MRACYPGSFNPLTVAHLAVADAAHAQLGLTSLDLVLSQQALGKDHATAPSVDARANAVHTARSTRAWLDVQITEARLLADIAQGYDWLILGADKWAQLVDPSWYGGLDGLREVLRRVGRVAVAPRPPDPLPNAADLAALQALTGVAVQVTLLDVAPEYHAVSSTAVRGGRHEWRA